MRNIVVFLLLPLHFLQAQVVETKTILLMGSRFDITMVGDTKEEAISYIDSAIAQIRAIEDWMSSWKEGTEVYNINQNAGIKPVHVNQELFQLIKRCIKISELTEGAFDITYASMDKIWKFDGSMKSLPSEDNIKRSVEKVGFKKIVLNEVDQTVYLPEVGMKIGFGAIGKGYAADQVKKSMIAKGVKAGIINASGDLCTWGTNIDGKDWMVSIVNPKNKEHIFGWLPIVNSAIVTSGDYEKRVAFNGKNYSHIIDPRTGWPATGLISVTILCPTAELADALATSVFVMGKETGLDFINQLKGVECVMVDEGGNVITSNNVKLKEWQSN